jgi:hypothetical protein
VDDKAVGKSTLHAAHRKGCGGTSIVEEADVPGTDDLGHVGQWEAEELLTAAAEPDLVGDSVDAIIALMQGDDGAADGSEGL